VKLNLTGNKIESLSSMPELISLKELVLDGNPIASLKELEHLTKLTCLQELGMAGCPIADEKADEFKKEVLVILDGICDL